MKKNKPPPEIGCKREYNQSITTNFNNLPMAITLKKMALKCEEIAIAGGKITPQSSPTASLYDISREWRQLVDATKFKSANIPRWSEQEDTAAGVIIATMVYLQRIGCEDVEQLLRDRFEHDMNKIGK